MANEVSLKIKIGDDGTLKVVAKDAEKAAKATDDLGKSTDRVSKSRNKYHKAEKGVAQAGLSSAKGFSKMRETIGSGSSGLVGAYAVLAANIFALTAAFGALQRASQVEQLEAGLRSMGTASGIAMKQLSEGLREATGNALTLEDAMRATALASSAGFDSSSIERLGDVARKASIALGRDTADSLNRLTKGAIKLEPELLDELGIMVRLDEATEAYATSLGKSASDLTNFEKRQAFMNAVLEEGERKFAAMGDVPTNAFDQLAATFQDLTKTLLNLLNVGLVPIVNFFAGSQTALFGALVLFGKGLATQMIPALNDLGGGYEKIRKKAAEAAIGQINQIKTFAGSSKTIRKLVKDFDPLNTSQEELNSIQKRSNRILKTHTTRLKNMGEAADTTAQQLADKKRVTREAQIAVDNAGKSSFFFAAAQREEGDVAAINAAASGNYREAISRMGQQFDLANESTKKATEGTSRFTKTSIRARNIAGKTALAVRVLGTSFLNMIPAIGQIVFLFGILFSVGSKLIDYFKDPAQKKYEEMVRKQSEANKELGESLKAVEKFQNKLPSVIGSITQKYIALNNVTSTFADQLAELEAAGEVGADPIYSTAGSIDPGGGYQDMLKRLIETGQVSEELAQSVSKDLGALAKARFLDSVEQKKMINLTDRLSREVLTKLIPAMQQSFPQFVNMAQSVKEANQAVDQFFTSIQMRTSVDSVLAAISNIGKAMEDMGKVSAAEYIKGFEENAGDNLKKLIDMDSLRAEAMKSREAGESVDQGVQRLLKERIKSEEGIFRQQQKTERLSKETIAARKAEITLLKSRIPLNGEGLEILEKEQTIITEEQKLLKTRIANYKRINKVKDKDVDSHQMLLQLNAQILVLEESRKQKSSELLSQAKDNLAVAEHQAIPMQKQLEVLTKMTQMQNKLLDSKQASLEADLKAENRTNPMRNFQGALNAADKLKVLSTDIGNVMEIDEKGVMKQSKETKTLLEAREIAIENELNMTKIKNEMERKLLQLRLKVADFEMQVAHERSGGTGDYEGRGQFQGLIGQLDDGGMFDTMQDNLAEAIAEAGRKGLTELKKNLEEQQATEVLGAGGATTAEVIMNQNEAGGISSLKETSQQLQAMNNALQPMIEGLRSLGPEGEVIAAVAQGAMNMTMSFQNLFDTIENGGNVTVAGLQVVGAAVSAIGNILQAQSNAKIAALDKEIAAEKKRDGSSQQSQARIAQLEKKKVAQQRKAFETNKKIQMATVAINTAAAYVAAATAAATAAAPAGPLAPAVFKSVLGMMGGIILAVGAAQLALIAGTSFQGGGGSVGASGGTPSSISAGSRTTQTDLTKSRSARGELAYFRGEQGIGGPEEFRPAFYGKKNRAMGGATGYVVGEQGPELFIPERPGTIVPADDAAAVGGTTNVTFSINAIDASGVEDVLAQQQGNIIGMIRNAANSYGEDFLEDLDESTYTSPIARRA